MASGRCCGRGRALAAVSARPAAAQGAPQPPLSPAGAVSDPRPGPAARPRYALTFGEGNRLCRCQQKNNSHVAITTGYGSEHIGTKQIGKNQQQKRNRSRNFATRPRECSETVTAGIKSLYLTPSMKPKCSLCIESLPSELLMKIFSYLDAVSLLCVGCVNKHFYHLTNDNGIWLKIYYSCFQPKRTIWTTKSEQTETVSLGHASLHSREPGYFKKQYIFKQIAAVKTRVMRLVKPVDPYTGLPRKNKEAIKASGLSWIIVLQKKNGKEYVMEKANLSFKDTSVTILWYSTSWPCLDILSSLKLFGVTPLFPDQSRASNNNGPRRRSLIAEYQLANLTENSVALGADKLVRLFNLNPGLLVGLWKEKNEIAFVTASLHYHQLLERSTLGSATVQYTLPLNKPILDDVDPEYGLHNYDLHLDIHGGSCTFLCGTFKNLFCRKGDIENGYLRLTVVSLKDNTKHLPLTGTVGFSWETDLFTGNVKDCYVMDVTLLDEIGKPFWCFSAPACIKLSSKASSLFDYLGHIYTTDYEDSEGGLDVMNARTTDAEIYAAQTSGQSRFSFA